MIPALRTRKGTRSPGAWRRGLTRVCHQLPAADVDPCAVTGRLDAQKVGDICGLESAHPDRETDRTGRPAGERASGRRSGDETARGADRARRDDAKRPARAARDMEGLSLIEVAIALAVSALLLGGLMVPLAAQVDRYRLRETEAALGNALEALLGYAAAHDNRLPCPDIDGDGMEDRPGPIPAPCRGIEGELPRATLGIPGRDGWGRPLRYRGNDALTGPGGGPPAAEYPGRPSNRQPAHRRTPDRRRSGSAGRNPLLVRRERPSGRRERRHGREPRRVHQPPPPRPPIRARGAGPFRLGPIRRRPRLDVEERAPRPAGAGRHLAVNEARSKVPPAGMPAARFPSSPPPA